MRRLSRHAADIDDTIRIEPRRKRSASAAAWIAAAALLLAGLAGGGVWWARHAPTPTAPPVVSTSAPKPPAAPRIPVVDADAATILAAKAPTLLVFRFHDAPHVLVLSFPSLHEQGMMLNRLGAFVEKAGLPHDRPLTDSELEAAIRRGGDTDDTYYYGHDYRAADMARFFAADAALRPEEYELRALLEQEGMLAPSANGAIISIPPVSTSPPVDEAARATILHHELSHGAYFTDPAYAAHAQHFWRAVLTEEQRAAFRRFLGSQGYDTSNEDLMLNEAQAYLINTPDPRFFTPAMVGLTEAEADRLRAEFHKDMPDDWLLRGRGSE